MKGPRRNATGTPRALDPIRARRGTDQPAQGIVAGRGITIDATGRYETKLPDGFYWDDRGTMQARLGDGLALVGSSPKRFVIRATETISREILVLAAPTTEDVKDGSGDTLTTLLQRLQDAYQLADTLLDARLDALEAVVPATAIGVLTLDGTNPVEVPCSIVTDSTGRCSIQLTRRGFGSAPGNIAVEDGTITNGVRFFVVSDNASDDGTVQYQVTVTP